MEIKIIKTRINSRKRDALNSLGLSDEYGSINPARRPYLIIRKKDICHFMGFPVTTDDRVKMKESENIAKQLDLGRELHKKKSENCGT